ncbi:MAG: 3-deoxy-manno-octulosonate cytidylyltransferase, partial [Bacteroidetes bacterium]|nr:3-deoxy-manno-octulosonate cytidylyltransferase [Bacteroidota bacterium]
QIEKLEQLRFLENGMRVKIVYTEYDSLSVDTPKDLELARRFYERQSKPQNKR